MLLPNVDTYYILHDRVNHHLICHQCENLKSFVGCFLTSEFNSC